jgi:transcription elongation factor Elf1
MSECQERSFLTVGIFISENGTSIYPWFLQKGVFDHMKTSGTCEMCGHHVWIRQKAHILAEGKKTKDNLLMLCPTCHQMFDTHVKPKIFRAMVAAGFRDFPESWKKSIFELAAEASAKSKSKMGRRAP